MQDIQLEHTDPANSAEASTSQRTGDKCQILVKKGFLTAKNVTSGVTLLLYSKEFQLGVLFNLPPFGATGRSEMDGDTFAKTALTMVLAEFKSLGVAKADLVTYVIGGSAAEGKPEVQAARARRALWSHGLVLSACDLGGYQRRSIWMDVQSGRTIIRSEPISKGAAQCGDSFSVAS
jgi:chemotaxis receptor (MCP) glutamine deamidase CheD